MENCEEIEALRFLMSKRDPNYPKYPMPLTEADMQAQMEIIRRNIKGELLKYCPS